MLLMNPARVTFGAATWEHVVWLGVDRQAESTLLEWSDLGPYAVFADVPERRVIIRVVQELTGEDLGGPAPGELGTLTAVTAPNGADGGRRRVTAQAVVTRITHELSGRGARRFIDLTAVSSDGAADPVTITDAGAA